MSGRRLSPRPWLYLLVALLCPPALWAASGSPAFSNLLLVVAAMLAGGKLVGELAERLGLPSVLGELLAGVVLGPSVLAVIPAGTEMGADMIRVLAELGVILLLFQVGLETDLRQMRKVGAAALTATSVGITARVLGDLGQMETPEARIILGAAVLDDIIGLVILSVVSGLAAGGGISLLGVTATLAAAVGFLVAAVLLGNLVVPRLANRVSRMRARVVVVVVLSIAFALALAALADRLGSALIIGGFAAGLILRTTRQAHTVEEQVQPVAAVLAPIFFVNVGAAADLSLLDPRVPGAVALLMVAAILTIIAIIGKIAAGWAAPWLPFRRLAVGVGMVPRGEVGLIFADIGRQAGSLGQGSFSVVLLMVMATTFVAPLALKFMWLCPEVR